MIALYRINTTNNNEIIKSFMKHYANKLENISTTDLVSNKQECTWHKIDSYLGQRTNFYGIFEMMKNDLDIVYNQDIQHLVKTRFPLCYVLHSKYTMHHYLYLYLYQTINHIYSVSAGISGAAFHAVIHLGYGMSINNTQLILEGMSYLVHSFLPFTYCPSEEKDGSEEGEAVAVGSMLELLELVKEEDKLRTLGMDNYENEEIQNRTPGAFQRGMICLSVYAQEMISDYTARLMRIHQNADRK